MAVRTRCPHASLAHRLWWTALHCADAPQRLPRPQPLRLASRRRPPLWPALPPLRPRRPQSCDCRPAQQPVPANTPSHDLQRTRRKHEHLGGCCACRVGTLRTRCSPCGPGSAHQGSCSNQRQACCSPACDAACQPAWVGYDEPIYQPRILSTRQRHRHAGSSYRVCTACTTQMQGTWQSAPQRRLRRAVASRSPPPPPLPPLPPAIETAPPCSLCSFLPRPARPPATMCTFPPGTRHSHSLPRATRTCRAGSLRRL